MSIDEFLVFLGVSLPFNSTIWQCRLLVVCCAHRPFYSRLQPFTYIDAAGVVSTLYGSANTDVVVPPEIPEDKFKTPAQIRGPAVVSHDHAWRCIDNVSGTYTYICTHIYVHIHTYTCTFHTYIHT